MDTRTDLAVEAKVNNEYLTGIESEEEVKDNIKIERVNITTREAAEKIGKPIGNYVTITAADLSENDREEYEEVCLCLAKELKAILKIGKNDPVLAVGLGNENITADSIGPKCIKNLLVTRHIKEMMPEEVDERVRSVCALSPSVMALTGIETSEIIKGVTEKVNPSLVIAVDALAARDLKRLGKTIQITNTGINPGSGVGNNRKELSENTLGIPVVAIGVPMVVDALTVAADCMEMLEGRGDYSDIYEKLKDNNADMVVTPTEVDSLAVRCAKIIANGINLALQPLDREDIDRYGN
ncbi:MAG: GPR endopeptidase [Clostridia bacterium]